jgi:rRNA processing protein Krr1/Pno1
MTLSDRERFIILFLHAAHSDEDNSKAFQKMEKYSKILNMDINDKESIQLMNDIDDILLDIIDLENIHLKQLKMIKENLET